jgi:hypothetical protein
VVHLSDLLVDAVRSAPERDWHVRAGSLEWTVEETVKHVAASLGKYTLYLGSRVARYIPMRLEGMAVEVTQEDWLAGLAACARAFRVVAEAAPTGARAFHAAGMADVEGYAALACAHVLEHGHDIAGGLGFSFHPPADVCAAVTERLVPWAPGYEDPWLKFLYTVGKADLPGHPPVDPRALPFIAPLVEWDGIVPLAPEFPVAAHVLDPATRRWRPVMQPE